MNTHLLKIQKETGIKMGQYDNDKNRLYHTCLAYLKSLDLIIKQVEALELTDEQFFINFLDSINEYSVKY